MVKAGKEGDVVLVLVLLGFQKSIRLFFMVFLVILFENFFLVNFLLIIMG